MKTIKLEIDKFIERKREEIMAQCLLGEALAKDTEKLYGKDHVVPMTGGLKPEDTFLYWFQRGDSLVGFIRGSYTKDKLEP